MGQEVAKIESQVWSIVYMAAMLDGSNKTIYTGESTAHPITPPSVGIVVGGGGSQFTVESVEVVTTPFTHAYDLSTNIVVRTREKS